MNNISTLKPPVIITAVGRSGTTIMDKLLSDILEQHEGKPRSIYEPFLWDHRELLKYPDYDDPKRYDSFETISSEGIFYHTHFPLFISEKYLNDKENQIYLEGFRRYLFENRGGERDQNGYPRFLLKLIRANGRLPLLTKLMPNGRYILLIRNPIDTLNSVINIFSFHGDEFHKSDYPRFRASVREYFHEEIPDHNHVQLAVKQTSWIFYQTMIALDYALNDKRFLIVPYEGLIENPDQYVRNICTHINVPFTEEYMNILNKGYGKITGEIINITKQQVQQIMPIFNRYVTEVAQRLGYEQNTEKIISKYKTNLKQYPNQAFHQHIKPELGHHASYYIYKMFEERIAKIDDTS